jgi:hypothetical protein
LVRYHTDAAVDICLSSSPLTDNAYARVLTPSLVLLANGSFSAPGDASSILHHLIDRLRRFGAPSSLSTARMHAMHALLERTFTDGTRAFESGRWASGLNACLAVEGILDTYATLEDNIASIGGGLHEANDLDMTLASSEMMQRDWALLVSVFRASQLIQMGDKHWEEAHKALPEDLYSRTLLAQDDYR